MTLRGSTLSVKQIIRADGTIISDVQLTPSQHAPTVFTWSGNKVYAGDQIVYEIHVNLPEIYIDEAGNDVSLECVGSSIVVRAFLNREMDFVSCTNNGVLNEKTRSILWTNLPPINNDSEVYTIEFTGQVNSDAAISQVVTSEAEIKHGTCPWEDAFPIIDLETPGIEKT